jgi:hypothetical protein
VRREEGAEAEGEGGRGEARAAEEEGTIGLSISKVEKTRGVAGSDDKQQRGTTKEGRTASSRVLFMRKPRSLFPLNVDEVKTSSISTARELL